MRYIVTIAALLLLNTHAEAGYYKKSHCKSVAVYQHTLAVGKNAYRDACDVGAYKAARHVYIVPTYAHHAPVVKHKKHVRHKTRRPLEQMAYTNPPSHLIFNHPARGMKHARYDDSVNVTSGTPRIYQQLGPTMFYGPQFYTIRDREANAEWQVK